MKKIILLLISITLTSCSLSVDNVTDKIKNIGKNPCWNAETKSVEVGCKK